MASSLEATNAQLNVAKMQYKGAGGYAEEARTHLSQITEGLGALIGGLADLSAQAGHESLGSRNLEKATAEVDAAQQYGLSAHKNLMEATGDSGNPNLIRAQQHSEALVSELTQGQYASSGADPVNPTEALAQLQAQLPDITEQLGKLIVSVGDAYGIAHVAMGATRNTTQLGGEAVAGISTWQAAQGLPQ